MPEIAGRFWIKIERQFGVNQRLLKVAKFNRRSISRRLKEVWTHTQREFERRFDARYLTVDRALLMLNRLQDFTPGHAMDSASVNLHQSRGTCHADLDLRDCFPGWLVY